MRPDDHGESDIGAELRQGAGREWVEEAAEDERMTEKQRDRRSGLRERILAIAAAGQHVRCEAGSRTYSGRIVSAGTDYAVIDRGSDLVALRIEVPVWAIQGSRSAESGPTAVSISFKGHLAELESSGEPVTALVGESAIDGSVVTVATDHVVFAAAAGETIVPLPALLGIVRLKPR